MATTKLTFGSVLNTIASTANTLTSTLEAAGVGASMLQAFAAKQHSEQLLAYRKEAVLFEQQLNARLADELAQSAKVITAKKAADSAYATSFDHFYALVSAA